MKKRKEGFTLVELLIVMAVIAALMGALVPVAMNAIRRANATRIVENMRTALTAAQQEFYSEHTIPGTGLLVSKSLVTGGSLKDFGISYKEGASYSPVTSNGSVTITAATAIIAVYYIGGISESDLHNAWSQVATVDSVDGSKPHPAATTTVAKYW